MYRVALRYKSKRGDTMKSVYLEFRPSITDIRGHVIRYEFLNLELYTKPKNAIQKQHNKVIEEVAEEIRCKRYLQLVRRDFSFISKDNLDGDFLEYFRKNGDYHGPKYECARLHFEKFCNHKCAFKDINGALCNKYRAYLLRDTKLHDGAKELSHNTASAYFNVFLSLVKLAFVDHVLGEDYTKYVRPIRWNHDTQKEYLSINEVHLLEQTPYEKCPELRRACLLSIYTGLRRSDVLKLHWEQIVDRSTQNTYIEIKMSKTDHFVYLPISKAAINILGERQNEGLVFTKLTESILNSHLSRWLKAAGINKHITFHCFRHTFAMMLQELGTGIYVISNLLGHKNVSSTQHYAKMKSSDAQEAIDRMDEAYEMK